MSLILITCANSNIAASAKEKFAIEISKNWPSFNQCDSTQPIDGKDFVHFKATCRIFSLIKIWFEQHDIEPFMLVGGSGKESILRHFFTAYSDLKITFLYCNANTTRNDIILKIKQTCFSKSSQGRVIYQPSGAEKLILIIKNVNICERDKYGHCMIHEFLRMLLIMKGYYDDNSKFNLLERVQIVLTANISHSKHLCPKLISMLKVAVVDDPDKEDLVHISKFLIKNIKCSEMEKNNLIVQLVCIYKEITDSFRNGYAWSFRHLVSIIKNLNRYDLENDDLKQCFGTEICRTFRDCLEDDASRKKLDDILKSSLFYKKDKYFTLLKEKSTKSKKDSLNPVQVMRSMTIDSLKYIVDTYVKDYEKNVKEIEILLFPELLANIIAIEHTLTKADGHLVLIGKPGVGRRIATRLVCFMHQICVKTPDVTTDYGTHTFSVSLKHAMKSAAIDNEKICFYIEEHQMKDAETLGLINSVVFDPNVPGLFSQNELSLIMENIKQQCGIGGDLTDSQLYLYFQNRVRRNLHMCLSISPGSTKLFQSYPSLCNRFNLKWIREWDSDIMRDICLLHETINTDFEHVLFFRDKDFEQIKQPTFTFDTLIDIAINIHESTKQMNTSPIDFMKMLSAWKTLHEKHAKNAISELNRTLTGLKKLNEARSMVDDLKIQAKKKQNELNSAQDETDETMDLISNALINANMVRSNAELKERDIAKQAEDTTNRKSLIEDEILKIKPLLDQSKRMVNGIKKDNLSELRVLKSPPQPISDVLSGVLMLLGIKVSILILSWFM